MITSPAPGATPAADDTDAPPGGRPVPGFLFLLGDAELTPGFTQYDARLQVQAVDVTALVRAGRNALGVVLVDGWFRGQIGITRAVDQWGERWRCSPSCTWCTTTAASPRSAPGRGGAAPAGTCSPRT